MAKVITQETFHRVVRENMEDLDMTEDEAIADSIEQLKAQGVNLGNIITRPGIANTIAELVEQLGALIEDKEIDEKQVIKVMSDLGGIVKGEISYQLFAASKGVYSFLIKCLHNSNPNVNIQALETLIILMDGYPDLLDDEGRSLLLSLLSESTPINLLEPALRWLIVSVAKHERTRALLIREQVSQKLGALVSLHSRSKDIVSAICSVTQVLTLDDDVRVVHGDSHEHARALAAELLSLLTSVLPNFIEDATTTSTLLSSITSMLVRNEFCIHFYECEGLKYVLDAMMEHHGNEKVARECFLLLKSLAGSDEVREAITAAGASPLLVNALEKHYKNGSVAVAACMCFAALSLRSPVNSRSLAEAGGPETLVRCLTHWKQNRSIMKHGCAAIRNQLSRCPDLRDEYRNLQVEQLLQEQLHGSLEFEAKKVLLDLGCDVKLIEEWRGTGVQLGQ